MKSREELEKEELEKELIEKENALANNEVIKNALEQEIKKLQGCLNAKNNTKSILKKQLIACMKESEEIQRFIHNKGEKESLALTGDESMKCYFLGGCSGAWIAKANYEGSLPGTGGFVLIAGNLKILIDPGPGSLAALYNIDLDPSQLTHIIVTHNHWDCVRDLELIIMAAMKTGAPANQTALALLAPASVIYGQPVSCGEMSGKSALSFVDMSHVFEQPPVLNVSGFCRGAENTIKIIRINDDFPLSRDLDLFIRKSFHQESDQVDAIPALDMCLREKKLRVIYLSDTEYRPELARQYGADHRTIDVVIVNVKTLSTFSYPSGQWKGYTRNHLGWKGLISFTEDLQGYGLVRPDTLFVLRAFGIETIGKLKKDQGRSILVTSLNKLRSYKELFEQETGQKALVPGITRLDIINGRGKKNMRAVHFIRPYDRVTSGNFNDFGGIYYKSKQMNKLIVDLMPAVHKPELVVLITGETGTGKDALAKALHKEAVLCGKRSGNLVFENAVILMEDLPWPHLVGWKKGRFSGDEKDESGLFTDTANGTLIIQEIGELTLDLQKKLLTVLEERVYFKIGDPIGLPLSAQIIMTTNRDISEGDNAESFRFDLWCRIGYIFHLPPLRERLEDIDAIINGHVHSGVFPASVLEPHVLSTLKKFSWPGNIRMLMSAMDRIVHSKDMRVENIIKQCRSVHPSGSTSPCVDASPLPLDLQEILQSLSRDLIKRKVLEKRLNQIRQKDGRSPLTKSMLLRQLRDLISRQLVVKEGDGPATCYRAV